MSKVNPGNSLTPDIDNTPADDKNPALLEKLKEHGNNSNIHGISHILGRKNNFRRLLWIIPFLLLAGFAAYQLFNVMALYKSYPTQTNVKLDFKPLKMPAITICNMNPIRRTKVDELSSELIQKLLKGGNVDDAIQQRMDNFTDIWNSDAYYYDYYNYYGDSYSNDNNDDMNIADNSTVVVAASISPGNIKKELLYAELTHLTWDERYFAGHQYSDFVMSCEFRGVPCDYPIDEYLSLDYGNCYTLYSRKYIVGAPTATSGLTLKINLENYESLALSEGYGAILMIHEYGQQHPEDRALVISGGTETHVKLQMKQIKRKGSPYGECNNRPLWDPLSSVWGCIKDCLEEAYSQYCQCQNNLIVNNDTNNNVAQKYCKETPYDTKCSIDIYKTILETDGYCGCPPPPCNEKVYLQTISSRSWPHKDKQEELMADVCSPYGNCSSTNITMSTEELEHNFLKLLIYFGDLNHEIITEEPVYTFTRLLSDVGGSLGLCLGVSLLCICELVEVLFDIIQTAVKKVCKRKS